MLARHKIGKHVRVRVFEEAEAVPQQRSCISPLVGTDFGSARFRFARDSPLEGDGFEPSVPVTGPTDEAIGKLGGGDPAPNGRIGSRRYCAPRHSVAAPNCRQG